MSQRYRYFEDTEDGMLWRWDGFEMEVEGPDGWKASAFFDPDELIHNGFIRVREVL